MNVDFCQNDFCEIFILNVSVHMQTDILSTCYDQSRKVSISH